MTVVNQNLSTVTVTAMGSGRRSRLGSVRGNARGTFAIPWGSLEVARFELEVLGGQRVTTSPVTVSSGERVEVVVRSPLRQSAVLRR